MEYRIEPRRKFSIKEVFKEIKQYKDLLWILAWRDYKVKYAQSFLGIGWAFIQPLATLLIFVLVFDKVAKIDTGEVPYPIFAQCGMVAWTYFSFLLGQAGNSVVAAQNMIKKIYFPRLVIPLSKSLVGLIDFSISFLILIVLIVSYGFVPKVQLLFLPLFLLVIVMAGLGIGIWVSALTVRYRDIKYLIPFLVQIGMYASPIAYPIEKVPEKFYLIYHLNPMAGVVEGFRWCILGGAPPHPMIWLSLVLVLLIFFSSIIYFQKVERIMADIV